MNNYQKREKGKGKRGGRIQCRAHESWLSLSVGLGLVDAWELAILRVWGQWIKEALGTSDSIFILNTVLPHFIVNLVNVLHL